MRSSGAKLISVSGYYFSNFEIANLLRSVAASLQLTDESANRFRIIAYNRAADSIEHASSDIKDLWDSKELDSLAGLGDSLKSSIDELFTKGKVYRFQRILKLYPPAFYEFIKIPGIGPVTAIKLCKTLGITKKVGWLSKLKKAAVKGKVPVHLVMSIVNYSEQPDRLLLHQAHAIADDIIKYLKNCPQTLQVFPLGSLRRGTSTIGDIDIAVSTQVPSSVINYFCAYSKNSLIINAGNSKASVQLHGGVRVDLMTSSPENFGSLLQHLTGSKHHNIALREYAQSLGFSLSEKGLLSKSRQNVRNPKKTNDYKTEISFSDEKSLYNFLKLDYIPPELREGTNELIYSKAKALPRLIELEDIKGDLHIHSSFNTHPVHDLGQSSLIELVTKAKSLNYKYIGLTEHNPIFNETKTSYIYSILKEKKEIIDKYNNNNLFIFNGLEVDIRADGQLALPKDCLSLLDYLIVSVHSSFRQSKKEMTKRIISGLSHPKARILGHPTGRLLQKREGVDIDWDKLFDYCQKEGKILEIDAWPNRLDLPEVQIREALKYGVKLVVNTDAHSVDHLEYMKYGVINARRGWATRSDIINCLDLNDMIKFMSITNNRKGVLYSL